MKAFMRVYGTALTLLSFSVFLAVTFPSVAITWRPDTQWMVLAIICLGLTTGITMVAVTLD